MHGVATAALLVRRYAVQREINQSMPLIRIYDIMQRWQENDGPVNNAGYFRTELG